MVNGNVLRIQHTALLQSENLILRRDKTDSFEIHVKKVFYLST